MARRFGEAGRKMTMAFTVPFATAVGGALKAAGQFQKSMALVEVAAQRAGEDTTQLREDMRNLALDMSKKTIFTVDQTSDAMLELARAGIVTADSMAQALPSALDLAAAGELDTATATTGLVNVLKQFELGSDQATRAANVLAQGAVVSTADVKDMIQAFSFVGPLAREMGLEIEDAGVAISIMSDRGLRGGRAGRGLRQILKSLVKPSKQAAEELADLGISISDEGKIRPFVDILEDLRKSLFEEGAVTRTVNSRNAITAKQLEKAKKVTAEYSTNLQKLELRLKSVEGRGGRAEATYGAQSTQLAGVQASIIQARQNLDKLKASYADSQRVIAQASGSLESQVTVLRKLTPEQREHKLATIFSARALSGVIPLIRAGKEGWEKYVKELHDSATAHEQATKVTDTLVGALQRTRNILEVLAIKTILPFVEKYLVPMIRRFNEWISTIDALNPKLVNFGLVIGGAAALAGPLLLVASQMIRIFALITSPLGLTALGIAALTGLIILNRDAIKKWADKMLHGTRRGLKLSRAIDIFKASIDSGQGIFTSFAAALRGFGPAGEDASTGLLHVREKWDEFIDAIETGRPSTASARLEELFSALGDTVGPLIEGLQGTIIEDSGTMWENIGVWWTDKGGKELTKGYVAIFDVMAAAFVRNILAPFSQLLFMSATGLMNTFLEGILTGDTQKGMGKLMSELEDVFQFPKTTKAIEDWRKQSDKDWDATIPDLKTRIQAVWQKTLLESFGTFEYNEMSRVIGKRLLDAIVKAFKVKEIADAILQKLKEAKKGWEIIGTYFFNLGKSFIQSIMDGIVEKLKGFGTFLKDQLLKAAPPVPKGSGFGGSTGKPPVGGSGFGRTTPAPVSPKYPTAQFGGTFRASRPSLLQVGETGPELISVTPIKDMGRSQEGPSVSIHVGTLIGDARSIDMLVSKVEDVLYRNDHYAQKRLT